jgi:hypothetical protein
MVLDGLYFGKEFSDLIEKKRKKKEFSNFLTCSQAVEQNQLVLG